MATDDEHEARPPGSWPGGDAKAFGAFRWKWLGQVVGDPQLPSLAPSIAYVLATYMNRDRSDVFPGVETLARKVNRKPSAVRQVIDSMVQLGHLAIDRSKGGAKQTNRYHPLIAQKKPFEKMEGLETEEPSKKPDGSNAAKPPRKPKGFAAKFEKPNPPGNDAETLRKTDEKPSENLEGNLYYEPVSEPGPGGAPAPSPHHASSPVLADRERRAGGAPLLGDTVTVVVDGERVPLCVLVQMHGDNWIARTPQLELQVVCQSSSDASVFHYITDYREPEPDNAYAAAKGGW